MLTSAGKTAPLDRLNRQRVARAQELLERTEISVEQIAARCGLGTPATPASALHRAIGVSPTA